MKVEVEDISKVEKKVEVELEPEMVTDEIEEQYQEVEGQAQVKGFRQGHVPRKIVERLFKDYVYEKVVQKLVSETMEAALDRKALKPVVEPVVDPSEVVPGAAFKYTLHVEVKPEIEIGNYQGLEVTHQENVLKEEDEAKALEGLRDSVALIREPESPRPVKGDDQVTAEVTVKEGETEIPFGKEKEQVIELWRATWIPGLNDQLRDRAIGDEVSFTAAIPEDETPPKEFRGKTLSGHLAITAVKERVLPELTDQFAKEYTKHATLEELKQSIRDRLKERVDNLNRSQLESKLVETLVKQNPIEVPPTLVRHEAINLAKEFMTQNFRRKPSEAEAEQFSGVFTNEATFSIQANYLLDAIATKENFTAEEAEGEELLKEQAERAGMHPDKLKARLGEDGLSVIKRRVILKKTLDFLVAHASIKEGAEETAAAPDPASQEGKA